MIVSGRRRMITRIRKQLAVIDAHAHAGASSGAYYAGEFPYCMSAENLTLRMEMTGIDFSVCFPFLYTEYFSLPAYREGKLRRNPRSSSPFPYKFENETLCREIYEAFPRCAERLMPFAFFDPGRRQREQAEFLDELAERYPLFGIKTATSYLHSFVTDLLRAGEPLLDFAARRDVPVTLHSAVSPGDPWGDVFEILKVVRARPEVRFAVAHTCRFDRRALEAAAELDNCFVDFAAFHIHCRLARENRASVAAKRHRFPADYRDHAGAMQKIAEAYPDTVIWGTDTPFDHWMGRFVDDRGEENWTRLPCEPKTEAAEFRKIAAPVRRRIAYENTLRFLFGDKGR